MDNSSDADDNAKVIIDFLCNPLNDDTFNNFFTLTYKITTNYLKSLKYKGYLKSYSADTNNEIEELANDILGSFLTSQKNKPFVRVFDYYRKKGITKFRNYDSNEIYRLYLILLFGFIKQELSKLKKIQNPAAEKIKRNIKDTLKDKDYLRNKADFIFYEAFDINFSTKPSIPDDILESIVEVAYLDTNNHPNWCRKIFEILAEFDDCHHGLELYKLLSAVVKVNKKHIEFNLLQPTMFLSPEQELKSKEIEEAKEKTLELVKSNTICTFLKKNRITESEAQQLTKMTEIFLEDLSNLEELDPYPQYYFQVVDKCDNKHYLERYKHVVDTIFKHAKDFFRNFLQ